jgi:polysaccharide pyruvyl transferase CsaB
MPPYGCGNIGDEAILAALLAAVRRLRPGAEPVVLSANPAATAEQYGVDAAARFSLKEIRREMSCSHLFISGGGGLIQDVTSWRSPLYYLGLLWLAKRKGLRTAALCQGVGPLRRRWLKILTARIFRRLDLVVVRDEASARLLGDIIGPSASSIHIAADAAWLLEPAPDERVAALLAKEGIDTTKPLLGVFLRPLPAKRRTSSDSLWEAIAEGLRRFIEGHEAAPVFVPMQKPADIAAAEEVMRRLGGKAAQLKGDYSPAELLGLTGAFQMVVGMRLHGLMFAMQMGVPPVGISYDPKVEALLEQAGLPAAFSVETPDSGALSKKMELSWEWRENLRKHLLIEKERARRKAEEALEMALRLLD